MPTMFEALSDGSLDLQNKRDLSTDFSRQVIKHRDSIVSDYLKFDINLNKAIAKIAKKDNLNDDQIQRIVEEVNNQVYLTKYSQLKGSNQRDVDFELASVTKVKELCGSNTELKNNEENKETDAKPAGEKIEKKASEETSMNIFNGPMYTYGNLAPNMKISKEEFITNKIAKHLSDKQDTLDKIAKDLKVSCFEVADALISLDRNGANASDLLSKIAKTVTLSDAEVDMIKEACDKRIESLIESRSIPAQYTIDLTVNMEKTAKEKFTIGKHSLSKTSEEKLPSVMIMTNKKIASANDLMKIASEFKNNVNLLTNERNAYVSMLEKCASSGLDIDNLEKQAGAASGFFQMC